MDTFEKFKKKIMIQHAINAGLFGIASGAVVAAVFVCINKFCKLGIQLIALFAALLGAAFAAGITAIIYKVSLPDDYKLAKRLDKMYDLKEREATMIAYSDKQSAILDAQRKQAFEKLNTSGAKNYKVKLSVFTIPVVILGVASLVFSGLVAGGSSILPFNPDTPTHDSSGTEQWNQEQVDDETKNGTQSMQDMIAQSDADPRLQAILSEIVEELENKLDGESDTSKRNDAVNIAKDAAIDALDRYNTKDEIGNAMSVSDDTYTHKFGANAIYKSDYRYCNMYLEDLIDDYYNATDYAALVSKLETFADAISVGIKADGADSLTSENLDDYLIDCLNKLYDKLYEYAVGLTSNEDIIATRDDFEADIRELSSELEEVLVQQKANEELVEALLKEMDKLVDPTDQQQQDQEEQEEEEEEDSDEDSEDQDGQQGQGQSGGKEGQQGGDSAGKGNGEDIYGSNDRIFTEDGYSEYGDVIEDYFTKAVNDSNSEADGELTTMLDNYFNALYGSQKP